MDNYKNILKDLSKDKDLLEKGYATFPFLNDKEITELKTFFYVNNQDLPKGLYATAHNPDIDFRNKMNNKINEVFKRANAQNFVNFQALGGTFMNKSKGEEGLLHPHQDWNIVDEKEFRSFNVWIPLVDVSPKNGTIQVLEKSHLLAETYRGINIPSAFEDVNDLCWNNMDYLNLKAGEALIYDHRLMHASKENFTENNRLVVVFGIIPQTAEMRYYYQENNAIGEYKCDADFFMNGNPAAGPKGLIKIQTIDYPILEIKKVLQKLFKEKETVTLTFWQKFKQQFSL